jgi:hypothetical protein
MKIHWLICALLLLVTGCKPEKPEPLAIKIKPLPGDTSDSATPVVSPTITPNASSAKVNTRPSPSLTLSPQASPNPTTTSQKTSNTKVNTRPSPSVTPNPKASPTPKVSPSNATKTKADTRPSPSVTPKPKTTSPNLKTITSTSEAVLTANNPKSRINFRATPSTTSKRLGYGTVGERVQIIEQKTGSDGYTWYKVRFPRSGNQGWVRKDLVKVTQKQPPAKSGVPLAPSTPTPTKKPSPKNS